MNALCHVLLHPLIWGRNSSAPACPVCTHCWKLPLEALPLPLTTRLSPFLILLIWGTAWGRKRRETLAKRAADSVCISPSVCRAWPRHSLQVLWIYHSSGSMFCAPGEPTSCCSDLRKVPGDKAHPEVSLGWDTLTTEMGKAQLSSFSEKTAQRGGIAIWSAWREFSNP